MPSNGYTYTGKRKSWRTGHQTVFKPYRRPRLMTRRRAPAALNQRTGGYLGLELKFLDSFKLDGTVAASAGGAGGEQDPTLGTSLNNILEGSGEQDRIGRKVTLKSVDVKGVIRSTGLADAIDALTQASFFVAIVMDTQTNGATLNSENVFKNLAGDSHLAAQPQRQIEFLSRFKVLKVIKMRAPTPYAFSDGTATGSVSGYQIPFEMKVAMNQVVTYREALGGIGDIVDNSLHVIAYASSVAFTPMITYGARVRFLG